MATYLVTGGAGFIGSNIVDELLRRGQRVRILDNFSTGREENVADFASRVQIIRADVRDEEAVNAAVEGVDYVIHQAALASVPRSIADPVVVECVGSPLFADAALKAVLTWRYQPATLGGVPVDRVHRVRFNFKIQ